ncbi:MAG: hypothetical protein AABW67_03610, partial [Nanoarchaeota archaeon]
MKNKKAEITAEEVLKLVLAVLCIIILVILAAGLYGIFTKKTDLEQAKESLNQITSMILNIENTKSKTYLLIAPKDWLIIYFSDNNPSGTGCSGKTCLCFCSKIAEEMNVNVCEHNGGTCKDILALDMNEQCYSKDKNSKGFVDYIVNDIASGMPFYVDHCLFLNKVPLEISLINNSGQLELISGKSKKSQTLMNDLLNFKETETSVKILDQISEMIALSQKDEYKSLDEVREKNLGGNITLFFRDKKIEWN